MLKEQGKHAPLERAREITTARGSSRSKSEFYQHMSKFYNSSLFETLSGKTTSLIYLYVQTSYKVCHPIRLWSEMNLSIELTCNILVFRLWWSHFARLLLLSSEGHHANRDERLGVCSPQKGGKLSFSSWCMPHAMDMMRCSSHSRCFPRESIEQARCAGCGEYTYN